MRKLILFLAAVSLVLFAEKALYYETTFSIEPEPFNSFRYEEMRAEEAAPLSIRSGRFLSVDPYLDLKRALHKPQGWNRYAYVENNPVSYTDPTGRCLWDVCIGEGAALWAAGAALASMATVWLNAASGAHPGKTNAQVIAGTIQGGLISLSDGVRSLGERWKDFKENPDKWVKIDERADPKQPPKGKSVREVWENLTTGETIGVHVKEPSDTSTRRGEPKHPPSRGTETASKRT